MLLNVRPTDEQQHGTKRLSEDSRFRCGTGCFFSASMMQKIRSGCEGQDIFSQCFRPGLNC
jgi:hypothetical protein